MAKEITKRDLEDRRRQNFRVELKRAAWPEPGEVTLSITHNGEQWTGIDLTPIERLKVINVLLTEIL